MTSKAMMLKERILRHLKRRLYFPKFAPTKLPLANCFDRALHWIQANTLPNVGIAVSSRNKAPYPEVTGYFIPTLLNWGEKALALSYGRWLVSMQNEDGSWYAPNTTTPYTFDTGQILKGLLALIPHSNEFKNPAQLGCDWLLQQQRPDGGISTPDKTHWGKHVPEAIHLYCLQPLRDAAVLLNRADYEQAVVHALQHYTSDPNLTKFTILSHFHGYIIEALIDLGERSMSEKAMQQITKLQQRDGAVPGWHNKKWVCSTGLFQYALIWYKLGKTQQADKAFDYAVSLQNESGGFFGSYGYNANYFPDEEISWAIKYMLDALHQLILNSFDATLPYFPDHVEKNDGRLELVRQVLKRCSNPTTVLDIGCGKGRFLTHLVAENTDLKFYAVDVVESSLPKIEGVDAQQGNLLNIPYPDNYFDFLYAVEVLEHAVNTRAALLEMLRVLKPSSRLLIIDKNAEKQGMLTLSPWERWFMKNDLRADLISIGCKVKTHEYISYDRCDGKDGLFLGWEATLPV